MNLYNYIAYLEKLDRKLSAFFDAQAPFIYCKKGCSKCCQDGDYPFSELEYKYLIFGYKKLDEQLQKTILNRILNVIEDKLTFKGETFSYECPFLVNNLCSVYAHRGIICRTFGLISFRETGKPKIPFCAFQGLNYSNVLNFETKTISEEKFQKLGFDAEPLAYNIGYPFLTNKEHEYAYQIKFGETKRLIDWLEKDFTQYTIKGEQK